MAVPPGGDQGYVKVGVTSYPFSSWRSRVDPGLRSFFAFGSRFRRTSSGGVGADITIEGFYHPGEMPLVAGNVYELHLGFAPGLEYVVTARLGPLDLGCAHGQGGEPGSTIALEFMSEGEFALAIS